MVSKNKKSSPKKHKAPPKTSSASKRVYLPRQGTLPGRIFHWLNGRPMLFAELSDHARREMGLEGDNLASQLSATLHDLRDRGVVVRMDPVTRKVVPGKGARGALYSLEAKSKAAYRASLNGAALAVPAPVSAEREPGQLDLSGFASTSAGKPATMPNAMYVSLMAQRATAEKQLAAIDALLTAWG